MALNVKTFTYRSIMICILFINLLGCWGEKSNPNSNNTIKVNDSLENIIKEIDISSHETWEYKGIKMVSTNEVFLNKEVFKMGIIDHIETYSFVAINNIKIAYTGGRYRISLITKSSKKDSNFGIRIQEVYPNRFDVVFDLEKEEIRDVFLEGNFIGSEKINIEPISHGWYKCTIDVEIYSSYFRLAFGPTNVPKGQTKSWEAESLNDKNREILILPNSIIIEELEN